jgi:Mediator complex subunit 13 C-terminal domain
VFRKATSVRLEATHEGEQPLYMYEPELVLAPTVHLSSAVSTLHCCYAETSDGRWLASAVCDHTGQVLHAFAVASRLEPLAGTSPSYREPGPSPRTLGTEPSPASIAFYPVTPSILSAQHRSPVPVSGHVGSLWQHWQHVLRTLRGTDRCMRWRVVVGKCGTMTTQELAAWTELLEYEREGDAVFMSQQASEVPPSLRTPEHQNRTSSSSSSSSASTSTAASLAGSAVNSPAYDEFVVLSVHPFPHAHFWPSAGQAASSATYVSPVPLQFALGDNAAQPLSTGFLVSPLSVPEPAFRPEESMLEQQSLLVRV